MPPIRTRHGRWIDAGTSRPVLTHHGVPASGTSAPAGEVAVISDVQSSTWTPPGSKPAATAHAWYLASRSAGSVGVTGDPAPGGETETAGATSSAPVHHVAPKVAVRAARTAVFGSARTSLTTLTREALWSDYADPGPAVATVGAQGPGRPAANVAQHQTSPKEKPVSRSMRLRKETLGELAPAELAGIAGGSYTTSFESCPTWFCTPLIQAVGETVRRLTAETSVDGCG